VLDNYQESEYSCIYPTTPLIESIVLDIPVGPNYKYLNNTIKDSSYLPTTECGLVIKKKYLKVYLEERLAEYLALLGLNKLIQRALLIEAGRCYLIHYTGTCGATLNIRGKTTVIIAPRNILTQRTMRRRVWHP
jgi:hypothetical protein